MKTFLVRNLESLCSQHCLRWATFGLQKVSYVPVNCISLQGWAEVSLKVTVFNSLLSTSFTGWSAVDRTLNCLFNNCLSPPLNWITETKNVWGEGRAWSGFLCEMAVSSILVLYWRVWHNLLSKQTSFFSPCCFLQPQAACHPAIFRIADEIFRWGFYIIYGEGLCIFTGNGMYRTISVNG